jgi:uncharacterized damage-inducible protein DinB
MEQFAKLIAHLAWADDRVLASLRSATAPDAACLELFAHVLAAEHVWLARLQGETPHHVVWPPQPWNSAPLWFSRTSVTSPVTSRVSPLPTCSAA